jgi:hypothetical protein
MHATGDKSKFSLFHYSLYWMQNGKEWKGIFNIRERVRVRERGRGREWGEWEEMKKCRFFIHEGKNMAKAERWNELIMRSFFIAGKGEKKLLRASNADD